MIIVKILHPVTLNPDQQVIFLVLFITPYRCYVKLCCIKSTSKKVVIIILMSDNIKATSIIDRNV